MSDAVTLPPEQEVEQEAPVPTRRLLVFELSGAQFGCDMDSFREILPTPPMTRLPAAPHTVCGLMNLRGTIVTVLDGGLVLGRAAFRRAEGLVLVVENQDRWIGMGVDDVRDIKDVPVDRFVAAGDHTVPVAGAVTGEVEIDGARVIVLDVRTVVQQVLGQGGKAA
ncbi:MAG TPA: chemotaxis protein CheW [Gemmatimonadaceae bacterium]|nr:chemotaxis protein CheW [Gemmatimonadaceae bacterium]